MFIVFNKQKIYSYLVAFSTVVALFLFAFTMMQNSQNTIVTSSSNKELPIYNVATKEKKIALTMNCAWNADDIDSILETLNKNEVKITFFVVGDWAQKYPEAVKKIDKAGHEIGNHSNTHPHVNNLSNEENIKQVQECSEKIKSITGKQTVLYRAPYGEYNNTVIRAAKSASHLPIQWNLDTLDYTGLTGKEMWARLEQKLKEGSIILTHNGTKHTADSLDMILKNIKQAGYQVVTVSELIYQDNYIIDSNGTQKLQ
ncbi:MAG: polysaccharide deacetylase family protein [Clostridia bacterium]|jgi:peptidoglycan/xylan/chitin deacetylase (PgdA/CDA1 family)|nr:polysaccharide deacetylase family protein [Clostridia bacterium]